MMAELLTSVRRFAIRLLPIAYVLVMPASGLAQPSVADYCEPRPIVKGELDKTVRVYDS